MGFLTLYYKVKLATLSYEIFFDCTQPSMGHILTKKSFSYSFTYYEYSNTCSASF